MKHDFFNDLDSYIQDTRPGFEKQLAELVAIPTVSTDPDHAADIILGAQLAVTYLTRIGFTARVVPTDGHPVVVGELIGDASWPTVTIYNHLDVQPADPGEWQTPPFMLTTSDDKYFGRGATDDKGPALTALMATKYAHEHQLPLNFKYIWEFEEESGSTHFEDFIVAERAALDTDSVLVSDSVWISAGRAAIPYGLRGLVSFELRLQTGRSDVHSGLAGGAARNPLGELMQIIIECYDATTGHVKVPGFYDSVQPVTEAELDSFVASGFDAKVFAKAHGLSSMRTVDNRDLARRVMAEPTFEVHGLLGGYTGPGIKNIIPPAATAKLSTRLVPGQHPEQTFDLIKKFINQKHPDVVVSPGDACEPYLGAFEGSYTTAAINATNYAFGSTPAFIREGGSIGSVLTMAHHLKAPIILLGLSLPSHGYHSVNEHYDWTQASGGIKLFVKYFSEIADIKRGHITSS